MKFGKTLKQLLLSKGVSQGVAAEAIEISANHMSQLATGKASASWPLIESMAAYFNMRPSELVKRVEMDKGEMESE